jgi:hypothetical protein
MRRSPKDWADRIRQGIDRERLSTDRRGLEQGQARQRPIEPLRIRADDAVTLDREADEGPFASTRRISDNLDHGGRLAD